MHLNERVVTVITKRKHLNSPEIQAMRAQGAEVWTDEQVRVSYQGIKKTRPDAPFKDMRSIYGKHQGQTAFICGAGPSLNSCPSKLPGPTFAINRAIKHVKADYWCFTDEKAVHDSGQHENAKAAEWAFSAAMHVVFPNVPGYLIEANGQPLDHKLEAERPLYWSGATFSWALHWAIKSGCKRIIMIGCEFSIAGYFDGTEVLPFKHKEWKTEDERALNSKIVSETARMRVDDMFGPDKAQWFDPNVELLDASNGYLPIPKTRLEDWL